MLKSQLVCRILTPPDPTWAARGQHLEWLEYAVQVGSTPGIQPFP